MGTFLKQHFSWTRSTLLAAALLGLSSGGAVEAAADPGLDAVLRTPVPAQFTITPAQAQALARVSPNQVDPNFTKTDPNIVFVRTKDQPRVAPAVIGTSTPKGPMTYHSGDVQHTSKIFVTFWGQASDFPGSYESDVIAFLTNLASLQDSGGKPYYNVVTQYYDLTNGGMLNSSTFGGSYTDTSFAVPSTVTQTDVASAATRAVTNAGWSVDTNSQVYVFTGKDKQSCAGSDCSWTAYCGYHSATSYGNTSLAYGIIPYNGNHAGCTPGQSSSHGVNSDAATNVLAHEVMETTVDPFFKGWYATNGSGEMGDLCNFTFGGNLTAGGQSYVAQELYSNADSGCVSGYSAPAVTDCLAGSSTPTVSSIAPGSVGETGGTATITGKDLVLGTLPSVARIGSATATITSSSATKLTVTVPPGEAGTAAVSVTTAGGCGSAKKSLSYLAPNITAVSPAHGPAAATTAITIKGTNLAGVSDVQFTTAAGATLASGFGAVTVLSDGKTLTATAPPGTGTASIQLKDNAGDIPSATSKDKKFTWDSPSITVLSPKSVAEGANTTVTVRGKNLSQVTQVLVNGAIVSALGSQTSTSFTIPSGATGTGTTHVLLFDPLDGFTSAGSTTTSPDALTYKAPALTAIQPKSGNEAATTTVSIKGTYLGGVTQVKIGSSTVPATPNSGGTSLTVSVPPGTGTVDLQIVDPVTGLAQAAAAADQFTYNPPTISSITPTKGSAGQAVTIGGKALDQVTSITWTVNGGATTHPTATTTSAAKLVVTAPAGNSGQSATISVTDGVSTATAATMFTYK